MQEIKAFFRLSMILKHSLDAEDFPKSEPYSDIYSANPPKDPSNNGAQDRACSHGIYIPH